VRQRFSVVTTHNEADNAVVYLNQNTSGSGLSGQVGPAPYSGIATAGVFGVFSPSSASAFGDGVVGLSSTGYGVVGEAVAGNFAAVYGQDFSAFGGPGVQGVSAGNGVVGQSSQTNAIVGQASQTTSAVAAGVLGQDTSNAGHNDGVLGTTTNGGYGVEGMSSDAAQGGVHGLATTGTGVEGDSTSSFGVVGNTTAEDGGHFMSSSLSGAFGQSATGAGLLGINATPGSTPAPAINQDVGVFATSTQGNGLYADSTNRSGAAIENDGADFPTLLVQADNTSTTPLLVTAAAGGSMSLDSGGNLHVSGSITDASGTFARTRNPGSDLLTYHPQETESTVEDVGTARLINGSASVALAPDFAQSIDRSSRYLVFLTPAGDNHGLYIASRTAVGFVVRESQSGRSTLDFDYRIVARPYGARLARMPHDTTLVRTARSQGVASRAEFARLTTVRAMPRKALLAKHRTFTANHIPIAPGRLQLAPR
jgi:hypothetical protein